jgi:hypothetical protein
MTLAAGLPEFEKFHPTQLEIDSHLKQRPERPEASAPRD